MLRHGESQYSHTLRGHLDDELTAKGWQQMQSTIEQVTDQSWDIIVSSSLKRCACFAEELSKTAELPLLINHDLKEMYFGSGKVSQLSKFMKLHLNYLQTFGKNQVNIVHLALKH